MRIVKQLPSQEYLKSLFDYDPETGHLYSRKTGKKLEAAYKNGYLYVSIVGEKYLQHRIIFQMVYGWCPALIDHADGNVKNNRLTNIRAATGCQNSSNKTMQSNNTSGITGIHYSKNKKKWVARIHVNKKQIYLGFYDLKEEAAYHRKQAEKKYFKEFAPKRFDKNKVELIKNGNGYSVEIDFQENLSARMQFENHELFSAIQAYEKASAIYIDSKLSGKLN